VTRRLPAAAALVLLGAVTAVRADWVASGACAYVDREFDASGFTGVEPIRPARLVDVQVIDGTKVQGQGIANADGTFNFVVTDNQTRNIYVRCLARRTTSTGVPVEVRSATSSSTTWSVRAPTVNNHPPTQSLNVGTLVALPGAGGEAFNLYDNVLYGTQYLNVLRGGEAPAALMLVVFSSSNSTVSAWDGAEIMAARNAGYDDTVVLHEMGHYVTAQFSASNSPGGSHSLSNCNQDIRLAWEEGQATNFGCSVRRYFALPNSQLYVRTTGQAGPGNLQFSFDVETQSPYSCQGATSETTVYTVLWDLGDGPSTTDSSPGSDEGWDLLQGLDQDRFEVQDLFLATAANISLEDFWDGWFSPSIGNGHLAEMRAIFRHLGVEYEPDIMEPNDTVAEARIVTPGPALYHLTYFADRNNDLVGEADPDWFGFDAVGGSPYTIETLDLVGDANTTLTLYGTDGTTVLASNDDRAAGDKSSLIAYTPSGTGRLYLKSAHGSGFGIYGSYDLRLLGAAAGTDADQDGFPSTTDCNDANPSIHPGAVEICNLVDDDCDAVIDEGFDQDGDGVTVCAGDCNNVNASIHPGAPEVCNGIDDDCDTIIDEGSFPDTDGDGVRDCVDPDDDNDGTPDQEDCAPLSYLAEEPPAEVLESVELPSFGVARLRWGAVPESNVYNVYRGTTSALGAPLHLGCLVAQGPGLLFDDPSIPPVGTVFVYAEAGANVCGEGSLGSDSAGAPRVPQTACGAPGADTDGDGVPDLTDTCPLVANAGQADADRDGRGTPCDNCPSVANAAQQDADGNGTGDACQDGDQDGFPVSVDCDDGNAAIHPGAVEIFNGRDDDCDGVVDDVTETVTVTLATWQASSSRLTVEATTNYPLGAVTLTVTGFGAMTWVPASSVYRLVVQPTGNPGSVSVTSTGGGAASLPVTPL
jgi:hypothetical protein